MCQPKPGLRCAAHARKTLAVASTQLDKARGLTDAGRAVPLPQAAAHFNEAQAEWDATLAGRKELNRMVRETSNDKFKQSAQFRLQRAEIRVQGRKAATKRLKEAEALSDTDRLTQDKAKFALYADKTLEHYSEYGNMQVVNNERNRLQAWSESFKRNNRELMQEYMAQANMGHVSGRTAEAIAENDKRIQALDAQIERLPRASQGEFASGARVARLPMRS